MPSENTTTEDSLYGAQSAVSIGRFMQIILLVLLAWSRPHIVRAFWLWAKMKQRRSNAMRNLHASMKSGMSRIRQNVWIRPMKKLTEAEEKLLAALWYVRDVLSHVTSGRELDPGEADEAIDLADSLIDEYVPESVES